MEKAIAKALPQIATEISEIQKTALYKFISEQALEGEIWKQAQVYYVCPRNKRTEEKKPALERVRRIDLFGGYFISNKGRFILVKDDGSIKFLANKSKYPKYHKSEKEQIYIHKLVYLTFCYVPEDYYIELDEKYVVHHIDTDTKNNKSNNLVMVSRAEHKKIHKQLKENGNEL